MKRTIFLFCCSLTATEIDSFTLRDPYMEESLGELDQIVQTYFDEALSKANQANTCDSRAFEKAFQGATTGVFWDRIETDIDQSETLDRRTLTRQNSVYRDVNILEGTVLHMARLGFLLKIGDFYIGSDKFGHFFDTGYEYYKKSSLDDAMAYGEMTERTYYGLMTTSVYSYGDLAANLDGYFFWNRLTQGKNAYVTCQNNTWTQQNRFTFTEYINAAWDEGLNCNYYRNDHVTNSVRGRIAALGLSCPVAPGRCPEMITRYGTLSEHVVSRGCF